MIHYTAMPTAEAALSRLCDPEAEVSAHYLVDRDGTVVALVDEAERAWHAGAGAWGGVADVNSRSIGIELVNGGDEPFAHPQMGALESLLAGIMERWAIQPHRVIGHSDMAPARKQDPGPRFDWRRLALQGLAVWPETSGDATGDFLTEARRFGYVPPAGADAPEDCVLAAFRMRFRPGATGPVAPIDRAMAADLARRFPVDSAPPAS